MPALSFKQKLVLSMMLVVSGSTLALLLIAERKLQTAYEARYRQEFDSEFELFNTRREGRLGALKASTSELASAMRFTSLLEEMVREPDEETRTILTDTIRNELERPGASGLKKVSFFRAYDPKGRQITGWESTNQARIENVDAQLRRIERVVKSETRTDLGYVRLKQASGEERLYEILLSKCIDPTENALRGTLLFGVPFQPEKPRDDRVFGLWVDGSLEVEKLKEETQAAVRNALQDPAAEGRSTVTISNQPHSFFYRALNAGSHFPPAYQVSLQPLAPLQAEKRDLRKQTAAAGLLALAAALAISFALASGLTAPINALVEGTHQVERGQFDLQLPIRSGDEVGRLTQSFNEMAAGLLLREKYRSVLDMVADKKIAEDLINGQIELGGEERDVSVLFCDIRGFTALTERMEPKEVIEMLNQHFTPLTRIVYEHHGAVDKFVGDLIMAIFGAPKGFGNDIENAARCALHMIEERKRLNLEGKYRISIGIGVASGKVVAGRMGSKDRLNYTVLGPRVNLASRLCGQAGPMEVVVDEDTWHAIAEVAEGSPTPELRLKGFATPIQAYKLTHIATLNERKKRMQRRLSVLISAGVLAVSAPAQEILDKIDESLFLRSRNGFVRSDLSGLLDLEGYYIDGNPPGLLFPDDKFFFNPRLSLFLDTKIGEHLYSLLQVRFDRGYDPGADRDGDVRFDEYLLRYKPFDDPVLNLQIGKFATVVGNWMPRHLSWDNPFINAPLPYENVVTVSDVTSAASTAGFLERRDRVDQKADWLPLIWGPSYATGASIFGRIERFDYAAEVKNSGLSSRPLAWDPLEVQWQHPTVSGRFGVRPNAMWSIGANASYGTYMRPDARLPEGASLGDFKQLTLGPDVSFAWHHLQVWAEAFASRFDIPNVGEVESLAYYLEAKYKLNANWFTALRWNQQFFDEISNAGVDERWDRDAWRAEAAIGYRHSRHLQIKLQYSYLHENGSLKQGEQLLATQLTLKF
jgi:class 3 adenylate cyclase